MYEMGDNTKNNSNNKNDSNNNGSTITTPNCKRRGVHPLNLDIPHGHLSTDKVQQQQQQQQSVSGTCTPKSSSWYEIDENECMGGVLFNEEHLLHISTPLSAVTNGNGSPAWSTATSAASSACNSPRGVVSRDKMYFLQELTSSLSTINEGDHDQQMEEGEERDEIAEKNGETRPSTITTTTTTTTTTTITASNDNNSGTNDEAALEAKENANDSTTAASNDENLKIPIPLNHVWYVYSASENTVPTAAAATATISTTSTVLDSMYDTFFQDDTKIGQFSTVQQFWKLWNVLNVPHQRRPTNFTLKFFKKALNSGDVVNSKDSTDSSSKVDNMNDSPPVVKPGGRWSVFSYDKNRRQQIWTELLLAVIGEADYFGRRTFDIQGIIFQSHQSYDSIQIWNRVPQMTSQNAQKMMKRLSSLLKKNINGEILAAVGEDLFLEYYKSHFGKEYSYSSSRGGSGYSSPSSRSGYSSPTLSLRKSSTARSSTQGAVLSSGQYSPRMNHINFHNKLRQQLHQRIPERIITTPSNNSSSVTTSPPTPLTSSGPSSIPLTTEGKPMRNFAEKLRRVTLNNGKSKIIDLQEQSEKEDNNLTSQQSGGKSNKTNTKALARANVNTNNEEKKKVSNSSMMIYLTIFFVVLLLAVALKVCATT